MARRRNQKRKPDPESDDGFIARNSDTSDRPNKRSKTVTSETRSSHFANTDQKQLDTDGNQYWEISRMRRVTISEFKGTRMVNIREYYEKDGKELPGKKGISMTIEQYSALVDLMPQIEEALVKQGEKIPRPKYGNPETPVGDQEERSNGQGEAEAEAEAEDVEANPKEGQRRKANIEATSDENENEDG